MTVTNTQEAAVNTDMTNPLESIQEFVNRFVVFADEAHAHILSLWILHTHAFDAAYATPYIYVHSAEPQSGKTRVMEVAALLARNAQSTANLTSASLFRRMADSEPTLFIDEVDTIFSGAANEELRGVLNSGYKTGGSVSRFVGDEVEDFPTFCPKMLVGIDNGAMPDTLRDRCIPMPLKRKKTTEQVERMQYRKVEPQAEALRNAISNWTVANMDRILDAPDPEFIDGISDRSFEIAEPLLVLAQLAGGKAYAKKVRQYLHDMLSGKTVKQSLGMRALSTAKEMMDEANVDRISSADLAAKLGISPGLLGRTLTKFDVAPTTVRFSGKPAKGYHRATFEDAWERYL